MSLTSNVKDCFGIAYQPVFLWSSGLALSVGSYGGIKGASMADPLMYLPAVTQAGIFGLAGLVLGVMHDGAPSRLIDDTINTFANNKVYSEYDCKLKMTTAGLYAGLCLGALKGGIETMIGYGFGSLIGGN